MHEITVRHYQPADRDPVRRIASETAFLGNPGTIFFDDREILADLLTCYFTDYEPESSFVAEEDGRVVGYITGARNVNLMMKVTLGKILPRLFFKAVRRGAIFKRKHLVFLLQFIGSLIRNEFKAPDFSHRYPAILHINLDKDHRNGGLGSRLMEAYLGYLHNQKIPGVHLSSISEHGSRFFVKSGFELLYKRPRTYYKHILKADLNCYCYGKKIGE